MDVRTLPYPWFPGMDPALADMIAPVVALSRLSDRRICWIPQSLTEDDTAFRSVLEML